MITVNCTKNHHRNRCNDKRIKRSFLGFGPRWCLISEGLPCPYQEKRHPNLDDIPIKVSGPPGRPMAAPKKGTPHNPHRR